MQLTVRTDDRELEAKIHELADQAGLSLNQAALTLIRRGAGLETPPMTPARKELLSLGGGLPRGYADRVMKTVDDLFGQVEEDLWR